MAKQVYFKKIDEFFKHDKYISIVKNFKIMEFEVDLVIGANVFISFGARIKEEIQAILLANSYDSDRGVLYNTNNYKEVILDETDYGNFIVYDSCYGKFIKVFNKNDLSWIPLVYAYYSDWPDLLCEAPYTCPISNSSELKKCGVVC